MLSDNAVYYLLRNYLEVEKIVKRIKKIDYRLRDTTLNKYQRMLLLQEKANLMSKLKALF